MKWINYIVDSDDIEIKQTFWIHCPSCSTDFSVGCEVDDVNGYTICDSCNQRIKFIIEEE